MGIDLPLHVLDKSWVKPLDMRALYAWCAFRQHEKLSDNFFNNDPLEGAAGSRDAEDFEKFLLDCGIHLLDITPCSCLLYTSPSPRDSYGSRMPSSA